MRLPWSKRASKTEDGESLKPTEPQVPLIDMDGISHKVFVPGSLSEVVNLIKEIAREQGGLHVSDPQNLGPEVEMCFNVTVKCGGDARVLYVGVRAAHSDQVGSGQRTIPNAETVSDDPASTPVEPVNERRPCTLRELQDLIHRATGEDSSLMRAIKEIRKHPLKNLSVLIYKPIRKESRGRPPGSALGAMRVAGGTPMSVENLPPMTLTGERVRETTDEDLKKGYEY